ncbi:MULTISPECIES: hypothetical protein [Bacteria]|jgi:hypothetical protein|uniref:hypothetical protein n=1 Tax=Bacteria TaxID=2 RepID=UPI001402009D|nr:MULTISPECIES: hypothetical protein [Bacteria]
MTHDDLTYFNSRAIAERRRADHAVCPEAAAIHRQLAEAYRARVVNRGGDGVRGHG